MCASLNHGLIITVPEPNKPSGSCANLRPITLLSTTPKTISTVILNRIRAKVDRWLSPNQSGFRVARSTADAVWAHRWNIDLTRRFQSNIFILGIDLSKASDTIDRPKLMLVLDSILDPDEVQLIKALLGSTTLQLRLGMKCYSTFASNHGTPQGDALSPLLFVVYLEAVLRDSCHHLCVSMRELNTIAFADDVDFIHHDPNHLEHILLIAERVFRSWSLTINVNKTERTTITRAPNPTEEGWRTVRKMGSLLGDSEDVQQRKSHATAAFKRFWKLWLHPHLLPESLRVRLYNAYVLPILLYNCGTWGLTDRDIGSLEAYHRRHLRRVLRIHYPQHISNADLCTRCNTKPLRIHLTRSPWKLFGHILRRAQPIPAQLTMLQYFASARQLPAYRGPTPTCLPTILAKDLRLDITSNIRLQNTADLYALSRIAQYRARWKALT
uniref:Endonucleasereverse transcriptase putative n=1 Tax=Albugo laibachii Nc14 TaxID=890382 RepID=F0WQF9_9STRA|nr:endonucleasereverse transcriptase putative [Albugo laibachii Nc14]|eukprot:CCA23568.1 endonucleasereverse transcriptase putative [Albugo laibachii Nc14]